MADPRIGMLVNTRKPGALAMAGSLIEWGKASGVSFLFPPHEASVLGIQGVDDEEWKRAVSIAVVIGGDGTFLRAARYVLGAPISLYGINLGHLGFLASGKAEEAENDLEAILRGQYSLLSHRVLEGKICRDGKNIHTLFALNDLVLAKGAMARVMHIEVSMGDKVLNTLPADGIIVSTPTGSTAYALSAGGPIVPPHIPCMIIVPICAHTLYTRPVLAGENDVITLTPKGNHRDLLLTQDGQLGYEILPGDSIRISLNGEKAVSVIALPTRNYFDLLQEKLQWGRGIVTFEKE
ncbi:NAD kinase [bioreactor metagenome]|jgi:NAD+ kinase|uniref:NAD kinase n=1 Tax=bioreactor metagenome TaxID=1076179 RepID=A0A644VV74_9ZZZZ|nr:NAD(+)/NADH kinase [Aminivibrio sp.]MDD3514145.1 NAD(+)/NADH kinase [Synergistaceae bacterium]NCB16808.1 NAD(+)/NADH kinase [Synergistales bacterium]MEA4951098.1 NAD(+)/NADH kinase [Aminivibrio sp.]HPF84376.1 NAD(+)/NADH kinase [Aminivibrio sp.]HRX25788.1 NAD(+)/NADH kinase [Aminivibrio sp.]